MDTEFDILIIGSGAGGGTMASALSPLCADGAKIAVLEWGPHFKDEEFTGQEIEMAQRLFFDSGAITNRDQTLTVACARGYGGSTLAYTGTSIEIPKRSVQHWNVPGLSHADLVPRMRRYKEQNNVHELPDEDVNENNQLPAAEAAGVQVITNCRVHRIVPHGVEAEVVAWPHGKASAWPVGRYNLKAKIVVVAAGTMHSSALLAHSRLPVELPALGRYFTCHPALTLVAQHERPFLNYYGFPKTYYCDDFEQKDEFILETCMYFPFTTAKSLAGFGAPHSAMMTDFRRLQMILVLVSDEAEADNRIIPDAEGNPVLHYSLSERTLDALVTSQRIAARIFFAGGAGRSEEHTSELQSLRHLVCRLLLE